MKGHTNGKAKHGEGIEGIIRLIKPEEWESLKPIFEREGGTMPDPDNATAVVAVDDAGIAGFWVIQLVPHAGPLWVREDKRGTQLWLGLNYALTQMVGPGGFYSFSDGPRMDHIFTKLGYTDLGYKVWKREV